MSWSVSFLGTPANVAAALTAQSATLEGQSKKEYDVAYPAIVTLVQSNVGPESMKVDVQANGHATFVDGKISYSNCNVTVKQVYVNIV
ncbi:MAG TPA: hypothetical protein VGK38_11140 [Prolixibacteraceae bacterium]|jgi:hypothetical protein